MILQCVCCHRTWESSVDAAARRAPSICSACRNQITTLGLAFRPPRSNETSTIAAAEPLSSSKLTLLRAVSAAVAAVPLMLLLLAIGLTIWQAVSARRAQLQSAAEARPNFLNVQQDAKVTQHPPLTGAAWWAAYEKTIVMRPTIPGLPNWNKTTFASFQLLLPPEGRLGAGALYRQAYRILRGVSGFSGVSTAKRGRVMACLERATRRHVQRRRLMFTAPGALPWFYWHSKEQLRLEVLEEIPMTLARGAVARGHFVSAEKYYQVALGLAYRLCAHGADMAAVYCGTKFCRSITADTGHGSLWRLFHSGAISGPLAVHRATACENIGGAASWFPRPGGERPPLYLRCTPSGELWLNRAEVSNAIAQ